MYKKDWLFTFLACIILFVGCAFILSGDTVREADYVYALLAAVLAVLSLVTNMGGNKSEKAPVSSVAAEKPKFATLDWSIKNGVLTISGKGPMEFIPADSPKFWRYRHKEIKEIVVKEGITSISGDAFNLHALVSVITLPKSLNFIGEKAFYWCESLKTVNYFGSEAQWKKITIEDNNAALAKAKKVYNYTPPVTSKTESTSTAAAETTRTKPVLWAFNNGVLTISGNGAIKNYPQNSNITDDWRGKRGEIKNVVIHEGVTHIGENAFYNCTGLNVVNIPKSVTSIAANAFYWCDNIKTVYYNGSTADWHRITKGSNNARLLSANLVCAADRKKTTPAGSAKTPWTLVDGVLTITGKGPMENFAHGDTKHWLAGKNDITRVVISEGITTIGESAFYDCKNLKSVSTPKTVTSIGKSAFHGCKSLTGMSMPKSITSIGDNAFSGCESFSAVSLSENLTSIGAYAFYNCKSLNSLIIPSSVTAIGHGAFYNCTALPSIKIPNRVTTLGDEAFYGCTGLVMLMLPAALTYIGKSCFYGCTNLSNVTFGGSKSQWASVKKGEGNSKLSSVSLTFKQDTPAAPPKTEKVEDFSKLFGDESTAATPKATTTADFVTWTVANGVLTISGKGAMKNYSFVSKEDWRIKKYEIKKVVINEGITSIGDYAFFDLGYLVSVSLPNSLRTIGVWAFSSCKALSEVNIPASVTSIAKGAFYYCPAIKNLAIPKGVTSIGDETFYSCEGLTDISIPDTVVSIGNKAFTCCRALKTVKYGGSKEQWNAISLGDNNGLLTSANIIYNYN